MSPKVSRLVRRRPFQTDDHWRRSSITRRGFSLLGVIGISVTLLVVLSAGAYFILLPLALSHAADADPNPNCTLIVPNLPLSAQGLATPYRLVATDPRQGPCNETNVAQSAFVQGVIYDPSTGAFSVYSPLVVDKDTQPAVQPQIVALPEGAVVGLWFGFNGNTLTLKGAQQDTLAQGACVNGLPRSPFGQFAYCNAAAFFAAANQGIVAHRVQIPPLAKAKDGQTCPTVRDFSVVDQDQSDNVQTQYLATKDGKIAQFSAANQTKLPGATLVANPSDNALLTRFIDPALGCTPWTVPDLTNDGKPVSALALDELQASADQTVPIALVPASNPMTTVEQGDNAVAGLEKTNLYRVGVDQIPAATTQQASGTTYCQNLLRTGMPRLALDMPWTTKAASPAAEEANSLFTFLALRFQTSYDNLHCPTLLNISNPVKTTQNKDGVVTSATFGQNTQPIRRGAPIRATPGPTRHY